MLLVRVVQPFVASEEHNSTIDIDDNGAVKIYSEDTPSLNATMDAIKAIVADPEPGTIYDGKVVRIVDFGAFVNFMPGTDGLVHISQIAQERVAKVTDYLTEGQDVRVKVTEIDNRGRVKLSFKEAQLEEGTVPRQHPQMQRPRKVSPRRNRCLEQKTRFLTGFFLPRILELSLPRYDVARSSNSAA